MAWETGETYCTTSHDYFVAYSKVTEIHGIRYLGENRTLLEKVVWGIIVMISLIICVTLIIKLYARYDQNPLVITFETRRSPLYEIPFPVVTICPETKAKRRFIEYSVVHSMSKKHQYFNDTMRTRYEYLYSICDHHRHRNESTTSFFKMKLHDNSLYESLDMMGLQLDDMMYLCKWKNKVVPCEDIFTKVLVDEGICYSFNAIDRKYIFKDSAYFYDNFFKNNQTSFWDPEFEYKNNKIDVYPYRSFTPGKSHSLEVHLKLYEDDFDYNCKYSQQGFRVALDNNFEVPRPSKFYFSVSLNGSFFAYVVPEMTVTSESVRRSHPLKRNCYMQREKFLKYFKVYTQENCMLECLSNYTLLRCDCVNFDMPREAHYPICSAYHYDCVKRAEEELRIIELKTTLEKRDPSTLINHYCLCLPSCENLKYDVEVFRTKWDWKHFYSKENKNITEMDFYKPDMTMTRLNVYFATDSFIALQRNEVFSIGDLLAMFGGILSLFTGTSVITVIALFYYLFIRYICNKQLYNTYTEPH